MKKEIKDKEKIKSCIKEINSVLKKHNAFPMMEVNLKTNVGEFVLYELDKMTKEEQRGFFN